MSDPSIPRQDPAAQPLGAGGLAANVVAQGAMLIVVLARAAGNGAAAAQAQSLCTRAGVLSVSNDEAFAAALQQLAALEEGEGDGFWLAVALGHAAGLPGVICETACDLALLAAELAESGDVARRADYVGIAQLAAAAAGTAALLVRTNLVISEDDWRLSTANAAATDAARAAQRVAADD